MKSKLSPWTLNAKKWREENGYITPEWEMYAMNRSNAAMYLYFLGAAVGVLAYHICL